MGRFVWLRPFGDGQYATGLGRRLDRLEYLQKITSDHRIAILAACAMEWRASNADAVVEAHGRIVGWACGLTQVEENFTPHQA